MRFIDPPKSPKSEDTKLVGMTPNPKPALLLSYMNCQALKVLHMSQAVELNSFLYFLKLLELLLHPGDIASFKTDWCKTAFKKKKSSNGTVGV